VQIKEYTKLNSSGGLQCILLVQGVIRTRLAATEMKYENTRRTVTIPYAVLYVEGIRNPLQQLPHVELTPRQTCLEMCRVYGLR
jgi:hypothetical protein